MCLTVNHPIFKIATDDIICYKFITVKRYGLFNMFKRYETPYRDMPVKIGHSYKSILDPPDYEGDIEVGLHAFQTLKSANDWSNTNQVLVMCIIPIGSQYYTGEFRSHNDAIIANRMRYVKIVKKPV